MQLKVTTFSNNFQVMQPKWRNEILTSKADSTSCLLNCSNHGVCYLTDLKCRCNTGFRGENCEVEIDPCSSLPCFNDGICHYINSTSLSSEINTRNYACSCSKLFYGSNCEWKINNCANETCSQHGYCIDLSSSSSCICVQGYTGEKCEITSQDVITAKTVRTSSMIIAILTLVFFILYIISIDLTSLKRKNFGIRIEKKIKKLQRKEL